MKQWERSYYSSHGDAVEGNWIEETGDGGYIVEGAAISLGGLLYMKLGGIYQSGYAGIYYIQMGMGWNF